MAPKPSAAKKDTTKRKGGKGGVKGGKGKEMSVNAASGSSRDEARVVKKRKKQEEAREAKKNQPLVDRYTGVARGPWGLPGTFHASLRLDVEALQEAAGPFNHIRVFA